MKLYLKLGLTLLAVCVLTTAILAYVNSVTQPRIMALKEEESIKSREALIPDSDFEQIKVSEDFSYYVAYNKDSKQVQGYTFTASGAGYSSKVQTMAGLDSQFKLIGIKIIDQSETPGLGANCTGAGFTDQFKGKAQEELTVDKDGGKIKSLSGATITTRAIANSLMDTIALVQKDVMSRQEASQ